MSDLLMITFAIYGNMEIIITCIFINNILSDVIISDDELYHNKSYIKLEFGIKSSLILLTVFIIVPMLLKVFL